MSIKLHTPKSGYFYGDSHRAFFSQLCRAARLPYNRVDWLYIPEMEALKLLCNSFS